MRKRFRLFLILGLTLGAAVSFWVWEVRGQNAQQGNVNANRGSWECKKFDFMLGGESTSRTNTVTDLEAFLQTAGQAQIVSSGLDVGHEGRGAHADHYDVIACRQP